MDRFETSLASLAAAALLLPLAGCFPTEDVGPLGRLTIERAGPAPAGSQIVAQGTQPIGFFYSGSGTVNVYDLSTGGTVYSFAPPPNGGDANASTIRLANGELVAGATTPEKTVLLQGLDRSHVYRITVSDGPTTGPSAIPATGATQYPQYPGTYPPR